MNKPKHENPMQLQGRVWLLTTIGVEINGGTRYPFCVVPRVQLDGMWRSHTRAWTANDLGDTPRNENSQN